MEILLHLWYTGKECTYVIFDEKGYTKCGIEKAYEDGVIDYQKPISCHQNPIRVTKYSTFDALNYDVWKICADACTLGDELKVSVYQFLKTSDPKNMVKSFTIL